MSRDVFAALLALLLSAALAAVLLYIVASSTSRHVRAVASLGLTEVPWWLLRAPRGRHVRPRGYVEPGPFLPPAPTYAWGVDMAFPDQEPVAVAVDEKGLVHVVHRDGEHHVGADAVDALVYALQAAYAPAVPDLKVRVDELLAHEEHEQREAAGPTRTEVGATDDWSPAAEVAAMHIPPVIARTAPDAEEARILAELDGIAASLREVPEWLVEFGHETDAWLRAADVPAVAIERHQRWRQGVMDWPTGEWVKSLALAAS
jgi:hypothetical protein